MTDKLPDWLSHLYAQFPNMLPALTHLGPLLGIVVALLLIWFGFQRLNRSQRAQFAKLGQKDQQLQRREKLVLAADFARELTENSIKCEAFITIYSDLLRSLRDTATRAPYEDTGDSIHQHPPLSRQVYAARMDDLSVLGPRLANDVTNAYAAIRSDPQYFALEANMPRANAIRMVEMVLDDAQRTLAPLDPLITALTIILRDGETTATPSMRNNKN